MNAKPSSTFVTPDGNDRYEGWFTDEFVREVRACVCACELIGKHECLVIDGGAEYGYYSMLAADAGAIVYAFEPDSTRMFSPYRNVRDLSLALLHYDGKVKLCRTGPTQDYSLGAGDSGDSVEVDCVPLGEYLTEPVHIVKLDVEGCEVAALRGMWCILTTHLPTLFIESHTPSNNLAILDTTGDREQLVHDLAVIGYTIDQDQRNALVLGGARCVLRAQR